MATSSTTRRIFIAARRLLDKEGTEAVTMRRVAKAVGITPMAIYRHYRDQAALLNALVNEGFDELTARLTSKRFSSKLEERLTQMAEIYLDHALENPRLFELMFLKPREGARRYPQDFKAGCSPTANLMADAIREGIESGHFRKNNVWEMALEMGALSHGLIMLFLGGRLDMAPARFRALHRRSIRRYIYGIRT
jgi:AcrR family transcriptional regulator